MTNILLCTLGGSWAVVPEIYAFISPGRLPLYQNHPDKKQLDTLLQEFALHEIDEIWVCTTQGSTASDSLKRLRQWWILLPQPPNLRIWQAEGTDNLATQHECRHIRELILRAIMRAHEFAEGGQVILSLAGGRKTMSADMQWAASIFGSHALLHVVADESNPVLKELKGGEPQLFLKPFKSEICSAVMPLITGRTQRNDLLDIKMDDCEAVSSALFPLPLPDSDHTEVWPVPEQWLEEELKKREKAGSRLLGNYFFELSREEKHENWRSLYRLPPRIIDRLRNTPLSKQHRERLLQLPKADLHRHLGGCLNISSQRVVGQAVWASLCQSQRSRALAAVKPLLDEKKVSWPWSWANELKVKGEKAHLAAALLMEASDDQLDKNLWGETEPRVALKNSVKGFPAYERPGDLSGSTLLSAPAAVASYADQVVKQCVKEKLTYVELRGSLQKYADGLGFLDAFYQALQHALAHVQEEKRPQFRFIIIADRRNSDLKQTIELAVNAKKRWPEFIVGLDMAGDESISLPENIGDSFLPAFEICIPVTIHAGEGEPAGAIWKAAYHLHADRIGHGLSLIDHPELAERFRNRDICLELCPTSNVEVVGYKIPDNQDTEKYPHYPLMDLWNQGLPITICTDNPGISRTTLTDEYLLAAKMSGGKLMLWDALAMIKQGFVHGFLEGKDKEALLKRCDAAIYEHFAREIDER